MTYLLEVTIFWYQSYYAYGLLIVLIVCLQWVYNFVVKNKKEEKQIPPQIDTHQEHLRKALAEKKALLDQQLKEKTIELAKQSKQNKQQHNLLTKIHAKVRSTSTTAAQAKKYMHEIRILLENYDIEEDQVFETQMDELHQAYYKNLKKQFPDLTSYDLRLSLFIKMGMNSREIAEILHVLPSSINVSRSRLRKKLQLEPKDDLYAFLNRF